MVKFWYDLETTGTELRKHCVTQIAYIIEVDGVEVEEGEILLRPHPKAQIDERALEIQGKTLAEIMAYPPWEEAVPKLTKILEKYVNKRDPKDKMFLCGFNNASFDDKFFLRLFELSGSTFFFAYFWADPLDVRVLAIAKLMHDRPNMPSFKQKRVALHLGIKVDESRLHDAVYDVGLSKAIYEELIWL